MLINYKLKIQILICVLLGGVGILFLLVKPSQTFACRCTQLDQYTGECHHFDCGSDSGQAYPHAGGPDDSGHYDSDGHTYAWQCVGGYCTNQCLDCDGPNYGFGSDNGGGGSGGGQTCSIRMTTPIIHGDVFCDLDRDGERSRYSRKELLDMYVERFGQTWTGGWYGKQPPSSKEIMEKLGLANTYKEPVLSQVKVTATNVGGVWQTGKISWQEALTREPPSEDDIYTATTGDNGRYKIGYKIGNSRSNLINTAQQQDSTASLKDGVYVVTINLAEKGEWRAVGPNAARCGPGNITGCLSPRGCGEYTKRIYSYTYDTCVSSGGTPVQDYVGFRMGTSGETTTPTPTPTLTPTPTSPPPPCPVQPRKVQCIAQTTCDNRGGSVLEGYTCTGTTVCCDLPPAPSPPDRLEVYTCPYVQTYDADVHAQGGIELPELSGDRKLLDRDIGVEGIVSSKDETYDYLSQTQWSAKTDFTLFAKDYIPYQLIKNKIKTEGKVWEGQSDGKYTISGEINGLTLHAGDVLVLLAGDNTITIKGDITIIGEESFFLLAVDGGDIEIDPTVSELHGIYYTEDGTILTGTNVNEEHAWNVDNPLTVRGQFIGNNITFERNLRRTNDSSPAEVFYYKPSLSLNAPPELMVRYSVWEEIVP